MLTLLARLRWIGTRLLAGCAVASACGALFGGAAASSADGPRLLVVTYAASIGMTIGALLGGLPACAAFCLILGKQNPWRVMPAILPAALAATAVSFAFPLYFGILTPALAALAGGVAAAVTIRIRLARESRGA